MSKTLFKYGIRCVNNMAGDVLKGISLTVARRTSILLVLALTIFGAYLTGVVEVEADTAQLGGGYLAPRISSAEDAIWRSDSDNSPNNTSVTLTVTGTGSKGITLAPQDVVFIMDHSGSLQTYDPQVLRILAARQYVNNMIAPFDRAAIIKFDNTATLFNHLTSAYVQVNADLEALSKAQPQGQTNFQDAIDLTNNEFETFGNEENQRIAIFFTDGVPDPAEANVTIAQMDQLVDNDVKMYTIGLGPDLDENLLSWMAWYTGGQFFKAETADELVKIYMKISDQFYNYTAGQNISVKAELSDDFDYIPDTVNITDGFELNTSEGTVLKWDIPSVMIGQNWSVRFRVSSNTGDGRTRLFKDESEVSYVNWRGVNKTEEIPAFYLNVIRSLPPPLPPPPPPPPAVVPAPIPPPPSVPVIAPSVNVAPVITATPNVTPVTIGQTATVPVEYMLAGLAALGIAKRASIKKKIIEKQKVGVGA